MTLTLLAATCLMSLGQDTKVYDNKVADIKFNYPSAWSLKRDRLYDELTFKVDGRPVIVQLMATEMNYPKEHWQEVTKDVNLQNDRQVTKQWEEELLGVPLLLTRVRDAKQTEPQIIFTGLLYGARPQKFLFRMYAPESVAAAAEQQWYSVLLTSNTISGKLPSETIPNNGTNATVEPQPGEVKVSILKPEVNKPDKPTWGSNNLLVDSQRGLHFYAPADWTFNEGQLALRDVRLKLTVDLGSEQTARSAWLKACGQALDRLDKVGKRSETDPGFTKAAFHGAAMTRAGESGSEQRMQWIAYGWSSGNYFILEWNGTLAQFESAQPMLKELYQVAAVAPQ